MAAEMPNSNSQPLQAWTCVKCGAALPVEAGTGELVTCGYCGTPFKSPVARTGRGGVTVSGSTVTIGGDLVGRNKITMAASDTAQPLPATWDKPNTLENKGISIDADELQVAGDVAGGSVVKVAPTVWKLGWWEKVKRLFSK